MRNSVTMSRFSTNTAYSLAGQVVPLIAGLVSLPFLIEYLGTERVGILAIGWLIIGYSGLLDLGLSRSIVQITAAAVSRGEQTHAIFWSALITACGLGLVAWLTTILAMPYFAASLNATTGLREEIERGLDVFMWSIPAAVLTPVVIGYLSGYEKFGLINAIKVPSGVLLTSGPLLAILLHTPSMSLVFGILVVVRWATLFAFAWAAAVTTPGLWKHFELDWERLRLMLNMGGWITVTNLVSPVLVYVDRFIVGSVVSVTAVAYYTTPQDAITKLLVYPIALASVLFPAVASRYANDPTGCLMRTRAVECQVLLAVFPLAAAAAIFSRGAMELWLGAEFAAHTWDLLAIFAVGVLINSVAQVPATFLQAIGKPKVTAILHLSEVTWYGPVAYWLLVHYGLRGGAIAWVGRIIIDYVGLEVAVAYVTKDRGCLRGLTRPALLASSLVVGVIVGGSGHGIVAFGAVLALYAAVCRRELGAVVSDLGRFRVV